MMVCTTHTMRIPQYIETIRHAAKVNRRLNWSTIILPTYNQASNTPKHNHSGKGWSDLCCETKACRTNRQAFLAITHTLLLRKFFFYWCYRGPLGSVWVVM